MVRQKLTTGKLSKALRHGSGQAKETKNRATNFTAIEKRKPDYSGRRSNRQTICRPVHPAIFIQFVRPKRI